MKRQLTPEEDAALRGLVGLWDMVTKKMLGVDLINPTVEGSALQTLYVSFMVSMIEANADDPEAIAQLRRIVTHYIERLQALIDAEPAKVADVARFLSDLPEQPATEQ